MSLDIDELPDSNPKPDFRRANGAPMIFDRDGKNQRFSRPSGWGKTLDDENALVNWKLDRAIEGTARDPALQARAMAAKADDRDVWGSIREAAINAGRGSQAADIGTAIHAMSERWEDPDDDFHPGEPYEVHLEAYSAELERLGLVSDLFEYHVANDFYRAAGTADRLYRTTRTLITPDGEILPIGTLLVGDLKTGKRLDFSKPGYAVQMAIYASGKRYDVVNDRYMDEQPDVNQRWGLLIHLPSDNPVCEALWVDLDVGHVGARLVQEIKTWRYSWRSGAFNMPLVPNPMMEPEEIAEALDGEIVSVDVADAEWVELMVPWAQHRLDQIRHHDKAKKYLQVRWPEGVPTPKQGITEITHMRQVLDLLDKTESEFELAFVPGRPDLASGHKDRVNSTNTPNKEK